MNDMTFNVSSTLRIWSWRKITKRMKLKPFSSVFYDEYDKETNDYK